MSSAISRSSDTARNERPSAVRAKSHCSAAVATTAMASTMSGSTPSESVSPSATPCVLSPPVSMARGSAENSSSSRFWMTIDKPKVTTSEGSGSLPSVPLST
ncbi:hypothetical protein D9M68_986850 [compost metagenome]